MKNFTPIPNNSFIFFLSIYLYEGAIFLKSPLYKYIEKISRIIIGGADIAIASPMREGDKVLVSI